MSQSWRSRTISRAALLSGPWSASSGDLDGAPPLGAGQEAITGGYQESLLSTGLTRYEAARVLNNSDIIRFPTANPLPDDIQ